MNDEQTKTPVAPVAVDEQAREIVEKLRADNPKLRIFQILVPDREDEVFLARKASWAEYKRLIGSVKNEADANEILVQKFLMHPKPDYEEMQTEWDPGLVVTLAQQIQKGLGFSQGATLKKW
jgi:hypothetical protein